MLHYFDHDTDDRALTGKLCREGSRRHESFALGCLDRYAMCTQSHDGDDDDGDDDDDDDDDDDCPLLGSLQGYLIQFALFELSAVHMSAQNNRCVVCGEAREP
jgi:hypothetical protein